MSAKRRKEKKEGGAPKARRRSTLPRAIAVHARQVAPFRRLSPAKSPSSQRSHDNARRERRRKAAERASGGAFFPFILPSRRRPSTAELLPLLKRQLLLGVLSLSLSPGHARGIKREGTRNGPYSGTRRRSPLLRERGARQEVKKGGTCDFKCKISIFVFSVFFFPLSLPLVFLLHRARSHTPLASATTASVASQSCLASSSSRACADRSHSALFLP